MPSLQKVTSRHIWKRTLLMDGMDKKPGILCTNCRAYRFGEDPDRPVDGCLAEVDLSRAGNSRLGDYREQEMTRRKSQNDQERAEDLALLHGRPTPRLDAHLDKLLREELEDQA